MSKKIVGMDFGTTNSGMAIFSEESGRVEILPLDPSYTNPKVARTAIYLTNDQQISIGREAVETFMAQNTGRPVRMEKVWVGEIEVRAEDMYYVTDVYVMADVLSPGRLFLSIKTGLRDPDYLGTVIGQFYYSLEDLIALFLSITKQRAEQILGHPLKEVVLGRPVRFAFDPQYDELAQNRLLDAALRAGYETVYFQYEPVAAAYAYAQKIDTPQHVLVFDFGGGTLDVTIVRLGDDAPEILATGGIPVAGDVFDRKLTRAKLPRHFGEGSHYSVERQSRPIPSWIYDIFSDWQRILELQSPDNKAMLTEIAQTAHRPREIEALIHLVGENYGLQMFDSVEQAKRRLSDELGTLIHFSTGPIRVRQMVTRTEFESIIREEILAIDQHLDDIVSQAGLTPSEIDAVVRTGGSAEIPVFQEMLKEKFGDDKVLGIDTFSSVTAGLGICAQEIAAGSLKLRPYTANDLATHSMEKRSNVSSANLALLQQRISLQEGNATEDSGGRHLVLLNSGLDFQLLGWPPAADHHFDPPLANTRTPMIVADFDEKLLVITNLYRFLLLTPRQLNELQLLDMSLSELHHFRPHEQVEMIVSWDQLTPKSWLTLITSRGFARAYRLNQIRERVESPIPYQFDHPLPGVAIAALGMDERDTLLIGNTDGRLLRVPGHNKKLQLRGVQALSWRQGEKIFTAHNLQPDQDGILLVTTEGYGKTMPTVDIPLLEKSAAKPPMQTGRKPLAVVLPLKLDTPQGWLLTTKQLIPFPNPLPEPNSSKKTVRLVKLTLQEHVVNGIGDG